jgi:hypothetical protein
MKDSALALVASSYGGIPHLQYGVRASTGNYMLVHLQVKPRGSSRVDGIGCDKCRVFLRRPNEAMLPGLLNLVHTGVFPMSSFCVATAPKYGRFLLCNKGSLIKLRVYGEVSKVSRTFALTLVSS